MKILILASSPKDEDRLRLDKEIREIEEGLVRSKYRDKFKIVTRLAVRPLDLRRALLEEHPQIVHFSGHGASGPKGGIVLEDNNGNSVVVSSQALGELFSLFSEQIACVVLNSCYSEEQGKTIVQSIPIVIGMNDSVDDEAAIAFSVSFYDALGAGRGLEFAFKYAKAAIAIEGFSGQDIPVILLCPTH